MLALKIIGIAFLAIVAFFAICVVIISFNVQEDFEDA